MVKKEDTRPIQKGDRFVSLEGRDVGRVVEVDELLGTKESASNRLASARVGGADSGPLIRAMERLRQRRTYFHVRVEAHPRNPEAIGHVSRVSEKTLRGPKYQRISR